MDLRSEKQSRRLPFMTSRAPRKTPKEPKWNETDADKYGQSCYHQKWNEKYTDRQGNRKTTATGSIHKQGQHLRDSGQ